MSTDLLTLTKGQSLPLADGLMQLSRIRHLPVVDADYRLVGLVTHRDVVAAQISALAALTDDERSELQLNVPVAQIMRTNLKVVSPDASALEAARLMQSHQYGCLPVVAEGMLVGIVTEADLLSLLIDALGKKHEKTVG